MPAERAQTSLEHPLTRGNAVVGKIDGEPRANCVQAARIFFGRKPGHACRGPFCAYVLGRSKGRRIVDDGSAAQTRTREKPYAMVGGRRKAAFEVQAPEATELRTIKIRIVVIVPRFEDDHVET